MKQPKKASQIALLLSAALFIKAEHPLVARYRGLSG